MLKGIKTYCKPISLIKQIEHKYQPSSFPTDPPS